MQLIAFVPYSIWINLDITAIFILLRYIEILGMSTLEQGRRFEKSATV